MPKSEKIRNRISGYPNSGGPFLPSTDHPCQILVPWDVHCGRDAVTHMDTDGVLELAIIYKDAMYQNLSDKLD